jgi:hypothetical protein
MDAPRRWPREQDRAGRSIAHCMVKTMKTYGNLILMTVICIVIFWLAMALRPAQAQAFDLAEKMPVGGMMQCGDIKVRKLPNGKLESNLPVGVLPVEVKDNEIFLNGKQCAFWSAGKMTIVCGDVEAIAVVTYKPSSNLDVKVDIYPTDYPLPASRRQIKPGDRGELKDGFMYINGNRCVPVTHWICPEDKTC